MYLVGEREALSSENERESIVYEKEGQLRLVDGRDETEVSYVNKSVLNLVYYHDNI